MRTKGELLIELMGLRYASIGDSLFDAGEQENAVIDDLVKKGYIEPVGGTENNYFVEGFSDLFSVHWNKIRLSIKKYIEQYEVLKKKGVMLGERLKLLDNIIDYKLG